MNLQQEALRHFQNISTELLKQIWQSCPPEATLMGVHEYDRSLGEVTAESFARNARSFREFISRLESEVDAHLLSPDDALDYRLALLLASRQWIRLDQQRPWQRDPSMYVSMAVWSCYGLLMNSRNYREDRLECLVSRLSQIPEMLDSAKRSISEPPEVLVRLAQDTLQGTWSFFEETVPALAAANPDISQELLAANSSAADALRDYGRWLAEGVRRGPADGYAVGQKVFQHLLYSEHYLTYSPHDLVLLAERQMIEVESELEDLARSIDPSLSWHEQIRVLKNEHPPEHELMDAYADSINRARRFVLESDLVSIPPGERLEICPTPEFERSIYPYAAYMPIPPFGKTSVGHFWVTPVDRLASDEEREAQLMGHCVYTIPTIALHEAYPGHHLQFFIASRVDSAVRKQTMSSLTIEGWALYCEGMMREQGFFIDPRTRLFQLKNLLWRCCRVLVDVGLHTDGMSIAEAVRLLVEKARLEEVNAVAEVKRYCLMPAQPLTYLIGKLLLEDLKSRYLSRPGGDSSLKAFHDEFLSYGAAPVALIARYMMAQPLPTRRSAGMLRSA